VRGPGDGWLRSDPWETGFVDLAGGQGLLGQVDGRTTAAVRGWLEQRSAEFRAALRVVVIDPHAGYARAVRELLPHAVLAVDHFHLVLLANRAVTAVRQRVTRELLHRRGRATDPPWANRRLLLRARERLSEKALTRMWNGCVDHDPTGQILTAWIAKEELRALCALAAHRADPAEIRHRLWAFYSWCTEAQIPELTALAETIETWWPAVLVFLQTGLTNARTEGTNRLIKQVKRAAASGTEPTTAAAYGCTAPGDHAGRQRESGSARSRSKSRFGPKRVVLLHGLRSAEACFAGGGNAPTPQDEQAGAGRRGRSSALLYRSR
jgi:hypothetical protein